MNTPLTTWRLLSTFVASAALAAGPSESGEWSETRAFNLRQVSSTMRSHQATNPPVIQLFTASPPSIFAGQQVILRWRTLSAERTWIIPDDWTGSGMVSRPDNTVTPSGQLRLRPSKTTTYTLIAGNADGEVMRKVEVRVARGPGSCTISGRVDGDRAEYESKVNLYLAESNALVRPAPVRNGQYSFEDVRPGDYRLALTGKYPNDRLSIGPQPPSHNVTCQRNRIQRHHKNFKIVSGEG